MSGFQMDANILQDFYNLKTLDPQTSWEEDSSHIYDLSKWQQTVPNSDNSYEVLKDLMTQQKRITEEKNASNASNGALSKLTDPLNNEFIVSLLDQLHIKSKSERAQYLINSKQFNVNMFLRDVHNKDSFEDLNHSLNNLDSIIDDQSNDLKMLVQDNFTNYVKIKNRLDKIYNQFTKNVDESNRGDDATIANLNINQLSEKVDESIRATNLKLKPIMDTSTKIANYKMTKQFIEENSQFFNLPKLLKKFLERKDFPNFIFNYTKGQEGYEKFKLYRDPSSVLDSNSRNINEMDTSHEYKVPKVVDKIWNQVEKTIDSYRKEIWESLLIDSNSIEIQSHEVFLPLMSKLLDLKEDKNPIIKWINFYSENFERKLDSTSDHLLQKIVEAQKRILKINIDENDDLDGVNLSYYLSINQLFKPITYPDLNSDQNDKSSSNIYDSYINSDTESLVERSNETSAPNVVTMYHGLTDSPTIVEMWLLLLRYMNELQSIAKKYIQFWEHIENFLDGTYQNIIVNDKKKDNILVGDISTIDAFKRILILSNEDTTDIKSKGDFFIRLIFKKLLHFFQSSQASLSNFTAGERRNSEILTNVKTYKDSGSPLDYGFVPPRANGVGCVRYLPLIFEPFLKFVTQLAQLGISSGTVEIARNLTSMATDRCIGAISSTKLRDISNFYKLENWEVYTSVSERTNNENGDNSVNYGVTQFPEIVAIVQQYTIKVIRGFLFAFEKLPIKNGISIVNYPSKQLLTGIEVQQIISMEAVLEAILKNAAKDKDNPRNSHTILTITNLQYIREFTFPTILRYFDDSFEWDLKSKPLEIFNLLGKMESSIFGNYLSDLKITLRDVLEAKFHQINWPNYSSNSFRVNDYIVEALMLLINVHSECFRIGPQLINKIIKETQVFISRYLFESFKPFIGNLSSDGLLQITVDLKFFEKVLGSYLQKDTEATLTACLQNCFQNNLDRLDRCITETRPIVDSNLERTIIQFAAFK